MSRHTTSSFASFPSVLNSGGGNTSQDTMQNQSGSVAGGMCDEKTVEYLRDLIAERQVIEEHVTGNRNKPHLQSESDCIKTTTDNNPSTSSHPTTSSGCTKSIAQRLLDQEIARIQRGGKPPGRDTRIVDIYHEKPIRLSVRVVVPVKEHPKFNFVGKLLGPKGNSMKRLQEDTMTKMAVLGKGSMRNKQQEEELRSSTDPKHQHLQEDLHVEITAFAPPSEAHARIAYALTEVRKYLIPDANDEIRQEQMREMEVMAKRNSSPSPGPFPGCSISSGVGVNAPAAQEGGSGGDDSPSSHDSGLGSNIVGAGPASLGMNCDGALPADGVNCLSRTDSATPPSSNPEIETLALRGIEPNIDDSRELNYQQNSNLQSSQHQRINTSSPLSCPPSPLSSSMGKIQSTVPNFNSKNSCAAAESSSSSTRSLHLQNYHACQAVQPTEWPANSSGSSRYSKTSGINSAKYSRGSSQTMSPARSTGLTAAGVPGGSTGRNRVYSILDKIRIANEERYSQHHAQPNHENVVSNLKPFNGGSYAIDETVRGNISANHVAENTLGSKAYKISNLDRTYYRTQISPYGRPK